jgi:hypothetical protein
MSMLVQELLLFLALIFNAYQRCLNYLVFPKLNVLQLDNCKLVEEETIKNNLDNSDDIEIIFFMIKQNHAILIKK